MGRARDAGGGLVVTRGREQTALRVKIKTQEGPLTWTRWILMDTTAS